MPKDTIMPAVALSCTCLGCNLTNVFGNSQLDIGDERLSAWQTADMALKVEIQFAILPTFAAFWVR